MNTTEIFLIALIVIFTLPYLIWRFSRIDRLAPLVVVQILTGILLGPGVLGAKLPELYATLFSPAVVQSLNGIAWWAVMIFVWIAGIELDLHLAWRHRRESFITAGLALGVPLVFGAGAAIGLLPFAGWIGANALPWQFVLGVGLACAVTALPILILLMEHLGMLRQPLGQRILRYASLDDIIVWAGLALILLEWQRVGKQAAFLAGFAVSGWGLRWLMRRLAEADRWHAALFALAAYGYGADAAGLHFIVGAFLAGVILDSAWFDQRQMDLLRHHVLLFLMPVFFLSTGLKTHWGIDTWAVFWVALILLCVSVGGKLIGVHIAGKLLKWPRGEAGVIGWLLQTKALIMIVFTNVMLDRGIISKETFTALLLMAIGSTMLTMPFTRAGLKRLGLNRA